MSVIDMGRKPKNGGSSPVTHAECGARMEPLTEDVSQIKRALIGEDLQSGLVKKFETLDNKLGDVLKAHEEEKIELKKRVAYSSRLKIAIITAFIGTIGSLIYLAIDFTIKHMIP